MESLVSPLESLAKGIGYVRNAVVNVYNKIASFASDVASDFGKVVLKIGNFASDVSQGFRDLFKNLASGFKGIVDGIFDLPSKIGDMLTLLFQKLFIPKDGYFDSHIEKIHKKFDWVEDIKGMIQVFENFFKNTNFNDPPKITADLNLSRKWNVGTTAVVMDFSWYKPYKPVCDSFLSAMLWVFFVWRLVHSLPSIISGVGGGVNNASDLAGRE